MLIILVQILTNAWAEEEVGKLQLQGNWRSEIRTTYLHDVGLVIHDDLTWENELSLKLGETGLYAGVWSAFPETKPIKPAAGKETQAPTFKDERLASLYQLLNSTKQLHKLLNPPPEPTPPFKGEIDFYVGYVKKFEPLTLDLSLWYYDFNEVGKYNDDQWTAQLVTTYTGFKWFEPYLRLNYYGKTGRQSPEGGFAVYPGANIKVPLGFKLTSGKQQTLNLGIQGAWSSGILRMDSGYVYTRLSASADLPIRKNMFLTPSIMYQIASPNQTGGKRDYVNGDKWRFGLACRIEF